MCSPVSDLVLPRIVAVAHGPRQAERNIGQLRTPSKVLLVFIHEPSDRVRQAAETHLRAPPDVVVPISWGVGLNTSGILTLAAAYVVLGTVAGTFGGSWVLAVATSVPLAWIVARSTRGSLGRGLLVLTEPTPAGRRAVALRAKRFAIMTTHGEVHRIHREPVRVQLLTDDTWWRAVQCQVGADVYYVNHNYQAEVRRALDSSSS
jgi:hypothetical protein